MAERFELDPIVPGRRGRADDAQHPQPAPVLRHAGPLPAARHRSSTSTAPSCASGWPLRSRPTVAELDYPTALGAAAPTTITLLGHDLAARRDGHGRVRRAGVLAGHPAPPGARRGAGVRGGAGRAGRPRLHPDRDRHPADLPVRAGLRPGRAGRRAARRRLPVPRRHRGLRTVPARRAVAGCELPLDEAGWDALACAPCRTQRAAGRFVPGLGHHVHKDGDPRTPTADADRPRGGPVRPAPGAVRGDRPGAPAGAGPHPAAERRRRLRGRAGRSGAAAAAAARVRAAGPDGGPDRAAGRGAAAPGRQPDLPVGGPATTARSPPSRGHPGQEDA